MVPITLRMATRVASLVAFAAVATPAYAVDGVVLINQAVALNGNVTPGDAPGFPVTISVPGSYRLSSNLTVPDANTTAIDVLADNVTIDLNGFSIIGPVSCVGFPAKCNQDGQGVGIQTNVHTNLKIFNGNVQGMGNHGIVALGFSNLIEKVHATSNAGSGIEAGPAIVNLCTASFNGVTGLIASFVSGSLAFANGGSGILAHESATNNVAALNGQQGIVAGCPSLVASNSAHNNAGGDIFTSGSGCVRANNSPAP